jgi:DNA-directed RNA polymerase subunit RPC12/RpoP
MADRTDEALLDRKRCPKCGHKALLLTAYKESGLPITSKFELEARYHCKFCGADFVSEGWGSMRPA